MSARRHPNRPAARERESQPDGIGVRVRPEADERGNDYPEQRNGAGEEDRTPARTQGDWR